jgi:phosphate-selective porin
LLIPIALSAQNPNSQDATLDEPTQESSSRLHVDFANRPSVRFGDIANIDIKTKWNFDFRGFSPAIFNPPGLVTALPGKPDTFLLTRARVGLKGKVTKYFDYEIERDMRSTFGKDHEYHPWKDNYADFKFNRSLEGKVGKFKMPFGLEETSSEDSLDYAFKSNLADTLAPGRERGAMLHGHLLKGNRLDYEAGVFRYDGENSDIHGIPTANRTFAARVIAQPLRYVSLLPKTVRHSYLAFAMSRGQMSEGLNSVKGETYSGFTYFDRMYVKGLRTRVGVETAWSEGPFSLKGEYIHMSEERKEQGIHGEDLPDKISRGWYVSGSWVVLGQMTSNGKAPKKSLLKGHGFGAVELSARYDVLAFFSAQGPGPASRSPRAPTILPNSDRVWTIGPTWYLDRYVKIQFNGQRERLADIERKAVFGKTLFSTAVIRLQLAM